MKKNCPSPNFGVGGMYVCIVFMIKRYKKGFLYPYTKLPASGDVTSRRDN